MPVTDARLIPFTNYPSGAVDIGEGIVNRARLSNVSAARIMNSFVY
jgi:hypothetical protein